MSTGLINFGFSLGRPTYYPEPLLGETKLFKYSVKDLKFFTTRLAKQPTIFHLSFIEHYFTR